MNKAEENYQVIMQINDGRDFLLAMYSQNPSLLKTAEKRIRELFQFAQTEANTKVIKHRGISLIELIMFIVIISSSLLGILSVMNFVSKNSADPVNHKQALAIAESLLEEIELQDFVQPAGVTLNGPVLTSADRSKYHIVKEYNGFSMTGITLLDGNPGPSGYNASVSVLPQTLGTITAASANALLITVTVTDSAGNQIKSLGYRTNY